MRVFIYILRLAIGPIIGLLAYFGYIPNWPGLMDWLTSADLWLINSAEYPALFILGIALFLGLFVVPESLRLVARHLLLGKKSEEYAALKKERPKDSAADYFHSAKPLYEQWKVAESNPPADLDRLIDVVPFPTWLPVSKKSSLAPIATRHIDESIGDAEILWDFAKEICETLKKYRLTNDPSNTLLDVTRCEKFDTARKHLVIYWNDVGEQIPASLVRADVRENTRLLKSLPFFDVALHVTDSNYGRGRAAMHGLGKIAAKEVEREKKLSEKKWAARLFLSAIWRPR